MEITTNLPEDFVSLIAHFESFGVKYMIIGAHAVGVYGRPRSTEDSDLFVEPSVENGERIYAALKAFNSGLRPPKPATWIEPGIVIQIGRPPRRIDLLNEIDGVTFEEAWKEHELVEYEDMRVRLISRRHLVINKEATGRPKDWGDADILKRYYRQQDGAEKRPGNEDER
jgi:hypothetical protein